MDDNEKLVEAVRGYPCLWQVSSRAYRDITAKTNALKTIVDQVSVCVCLVCLFFLTHTYVYIILDEEGAFADAVAACLHRLFVVMAEKTTESR